MYEFVNSACRTEVCEIRRGAFFFLLLLQVVRLRRVRRRVHARAIDLNEMREEEKKTILRASKLINTTI